ncbi:hypothetical protein AQUSIP_03020 [Aquicella siphonis]|uniref:Uncharacterized protein n=1 Tax=Aquicella siphonis TaxID=254247 RepID=A0A5E4PF28_9COXI|nr:hypothetical protein [Aquicella siphonis]VVC75027.1 hypothetical protein AQUSIP_03020 [Aquicella siphonis]
MKSSRTAHLPPKKRLLAAFRNNNTSSATVEEPGRPDTRLETVNPTEFDITDCSQPKRIRGAETTSPGLKQNSLFPVVQPVLAKPPLVVALEQHLGLMNPQGLKYFHLSEILREIALYHRQKRHTHTPQEADILSAILFLYEKAIVIDPHNIYAENEYKTYQEHVPLSFTATETLARKSRYQKECAQHGTVNFFWDSLNKYIQRLVIIFPDKVNDVLADLCNHLNTTAAILHMRNKHIEPKLHDQSVAAFSSAALLLQPQETVVKFGF